MLKQLPSLTKYYGLTPMDIEQMTLREISEYQTRMRQALEEKR